MKMIRLEAKGFKSFGDKVILHFGDGVTGVVGPNGCGKSNIVDAIRWVLGEQKIRNLRSDKMESVIFNGTAKRAPLQVAEVALTFDNDKGVLSNDYHQVTIARRYHRSGESEYLINGVNCRLKDIENLFLDTGIGSDSYAIIELKMVDDLLNDRDGSRRGLFEEAAGVSKFKHRRKETFKRLTEVTGDLERVDDLLHEITRNLKHLEKQAGQADKYFKLKERYHRVALQAALREYERRKKDLNTLQSQARALSQEKEALTANISKLEKHTEDLKREVHTAEALVASRQKSYQELLEKIKKIENDRKLTSERRRSELQRKEQVNQQLLADLSQQKNADSKLESLAEERKAIEVQIASDNERLNNAQNRNLLESNILKKSSQDLEEAELGWRNADDKLKRLQRDQEITHAKLSAYRQELEHVENKTIEHSSGMDEFDAQINDLNEVLVSKKAEIELLEKLEDDRKLSEKLLLEEQEELREKKGLTARKRDAIQNEYSLTKSLQDNLDGYPEAIRYLRKTVGWSSGKEAPLVSEVITIPEAFRVGLEFYLEPVLNHYVVDNESEALKAIQFLNEAAKGKASFIVLSQLEALNLEPSAKLESQDLISALALAEYDVKFVALAQYLLQDVYFSTVPSQHENTQKILIAKDGHMLRKPAILSGGSVGLYSGKRIGRVRNLEKLKSDLNEISKELLQYENKLKQLNERINMLRTQNHSSKLEGLRQQFSKTEQAVAAMHIRKEQSQQRLLDESQRVNNINQSIEKLAHELRIRQPEIEQLSALTQTLLITYTEARKLRNEAEVASNQHRELLNKIKIEAMRSQSQLEHIGNEIQIRQEDKLRLITRIEKSEQELLNADIELEKLTANDLVGDDELKEMHEELNAIQDGVNEATKLLFKMRGNVDAAISEIRELTRRREQNQTLISEIATQAAGLEARQEATEERLLAEFNVKPTLLEIDVDFVSIDDATLTKEASDLRQQLDRMGPINPVAMESYKEMKERHEFISSQKNDLVTAQQDLEQTISTIESEAQASFMLTFNQIRDNFHRVFKSLFAEEDSCDLVLAQTDNPLESPIDIVARPKGKRPLTINQLSGGEKTLTAIALLFSIYLIKPAPFCIFDEVDAPLDDNNIDKFNNIIRDFSGNSQFIVVTHNKRTMTHADVLYGITMVEQGVSRVIPVDLREVLV